MAVVAVNQVPDLAGFTQFVRNVVGIPVGNLPDSDPVLQHALDYALNIVNLDLGMVSAQPSSWSPYELAVFNLAAHVLIEYAEDSSYPIAALSWAAGLVTGTTGSPHTILPGDTAKLVAVSPLAYAPPSGVTITDVTNTTHFGYHLPRDPGTATILPGASIQGQYFAKARKAFKLNTFVPGVVSSTSDLSTSVGLDNPDFFKNLTLDQLQLLKTPWGQRYLSIAQKYGPSVWGLTI
jgi:hypothetical protein